MQLCKNGIMYIVFLKIFGFRGTHGTHANAATAQYSKVRGGGACSKLGAQITSESLKSGCAKSGIYLIETQKVGAQMRTLAH